MAQRLSNPDLVAPFRTTFGSAEFVTEREPATVGLRDGSVVRLARESRLSVHDRHDAREVSLVGRGYFAVAHDNEAPFTIRTDAGTVTVLGTRFDLTVTGGDLRLIVIEGRVRLTVRGFDVDVVAGQMAQVMKGNLVPPIDVPDPESLVDWVGNFVAFHNTPLRAVAHEIENRHGVAMVFSDPALGDRTVTAFFAGRSFDEIAEVICVVTQLQCKIVDNVLTMSPGR
jgi:transmembrane sensor